MSSEIKANTISEVTSANGVTIDGVNIKDSQVPASAGGSMVLLQSGDLTGDSVVVGSSTLLSSTYKIYKLFLSNINIEDDNKDVRVRFYYGGTQQTGGIYDYHVASYKVDAAIVQLRGSGESSGAFIPDDLGNNDDQSTHYEFNISTPEKTLIHALHYRGTATNSSEEAFTVHGYIRTMTTTGALTGFNFYPETGDFENGTFQLYGLKNA